MNYINAHQAIISIRKQGIKISDVEEEIIKMEFDIAKIRSELPLTEKFVKSCLKEFQTEDI